jgi:hypothetical protein
LARQRRLSLDGAPEVQQDLLGDALANNAANAPSSGSVPPDTMQKFDVMKGIILMGLREALFQMDAS